MTTDLVTLDGDRPPAPAAPQIAAQLEWLPLTIDAANVEEAERIARAKERGADFAPYLTAEYGGFAERPWLIRVNTRLKLGVYSRLMRAIAAARGGSPAAQQAMMQGLDLSDAMLAFLRGQVVDWNFVDESGSVWLYEPGQWDYADTALLTLSFSTVLRRFSQAPKAPAPTPTPLASTPTEGTPSPGT